MEVEIRVALQVEVKPWSSEFNKGSERELKGDTNGGSRGKVANTLLFGRGLKFELVGAGDIDSEMVLQAQVVGRGLRVVLVENVAESLFMALLEGWTVTSNIDSMLVSSVASSTGQPTKSKKQVSWTQYNVYLQILNSLRAKQ